MSNLSEALLHRLNLARLGDDRLNLSFQSLVASPIGLSPWTSWLVLCLVRHRGRQQFVLESMSSRLDGDAESIARAGSMGHPKRARVGLVPGDTDWEYRFHGRGCCMTHRVTGESIDVDFHDETADWIDRFFFNTYLESLDTPTFVERRLKELYPTSRTVELGIDELIEGGVLESNENSSSFRLRIPWEMLCDQLDEIEDKFQKTGIQSLVAAAISDWILLAKLNPEFDDQAKLCFREMYENVEKRFFEGPRSAEALAMLADWDSPRLTACLSNALSGPPSSVLSVALRIVEKSRSFNQWESQLRSIVGRIDPNGDLPSPYIWVSAAKLLIRMGAVADWESQFARLSRNELSEAALFAMEVNLPFAMELVRKSLRSCIPNNRIEMAAALAVIDLSWCHSELVAVLNETSDQERTAECRAALLESRDVELHRFVEEWEARYPYEKPSEEDLTVGDWVLMRCTQYIQFEMQSLHDRVIVLRNRFRPGAVEE